MSEFRFRAAAALELRRKQETEAATALARAEAELRASEQLVAQAETARRTAQDRLVSVERHGSDVATLFWHRNWIVRLSNDLTERRRQATHLAEAVRQAEQRWRQARQRRLALERMHERALRRFKQEQLRQELKVIDELARLRYVMPDAWRDES
jgi:flagellar export protein FliJ